MPAGAAKRSERYASEITIRTDGSLEVTETIAATVEGVCIRRGIDRDFPTRDRDAGGRRVAFGFVVHAVERDGRPERWRVEERESGVRIWIGDPDLLLEAGRYVWRLSYWTHGQLGVLDAHDELHGKLTSNDWASAV